MSRVPLRKSTKADHIPPDDMEAEIMELAPEIGERILVRAARLEAVLWLYQTRKAQA